ncbi:hypothetical protein IFM89_021201 [Coptis chinensis]|uniref:Wall-associated receptor kinase galacturonan-binding domain-containing protein n=1 Tax=Coptis chinensis TaxID=261450 RepID=A0A835LNA8_9MAGN|nr:hypothetical protein IFM89_021201 [Coptis chinensis]
MEKRFSPLLFMAVAVLFHDGCTITMAATHCENCGSNTVPYPLSTGPDCGDQSYKIRCDSGTLRFDAVNGTSYTITTINPEIQRFVIQPPSFVSNTCVSSDIRTEGLQLNSSLPFNVTSSNTIMYLNCSDTLLRSPLNCTSTSLCHSYINDTVDGSVCDSAPLCCTFRAGGSTTAYRIRVRDSGCRAYTSYVNLDYSLPVSRWPNPGLEIQWVSPQEPICRSQSDCESGSNSNCAPDPVLTGQSRCFCDGKYRWDPVRGTCVESKCPMNPVYGFCLLLRLEKCLDLIKMQIIQY